MSSRELTRSIASTAEHPVMTHSAHGRAGGGGEPRRGAVGPHGGGLRDGPHHGGQPPHLRRHPHPDPDGHLPQMVRHLATASVASLLPSDGNLLLCSYLTCLQARIHLCIYIARPEFMTVVSPWLAGLVCMRPPSNCGKPTFLDHSASNHNTVTTYRPSRHAAQG